MKRKPNVSLSIDELTLVVRSLRALRWALDNGSHPMAAHMSDASMNRASSEAFKAWWLAEDLLKQVKK